MNVLLLRLKHGVKHFVGRFGVELRRTRSGYGPGTAARPLAVTNLFYEDLRARGFVPSFVVDVGANRGDWTEMALGVWPDARYLLLEPQPEFAAGLDRLAATHAGVEWMPLAAGPEDDELMLTLWPDLNGSSLTPTERERTAEMKNQRQVSVRRLEDLVRDGGPAGPGPNPARIPDLVKLDIQGFELEALKGAESFFGRTELFVLEVSLYPFYERTPIVSEVVAFMHERGYELYDVADYIRRASDGALAQMDLAFARRDGSLRASNKW